MSLGMTVRELLQRMDSRELSEWLAYDRIEPIGAVRSDLGAGIISATIANCHRGKRSQPYTPADFMPLHKASDSGEDDVNMTAAKLNSLAAAGFAVKEDNGLINGEAKGGQQTDIVRGYNRAGHDLVVRLVDDLLVRFDIHWSLLFY